MLTSKRLSTLIKNSLSGAGATCNAPREMSFAATGIFPPQVALSGHCQAAAIAAVIAKQESRLEGSKHKSVCICNLAVWLTFPETKSALSTGQGFRLSKIFSGHKTTASCQSQVKLYISGRLQVEPAFHTGDRYP